MSVLDVIMLFITCVVDIYYVLLFCNSFFDKRDWIVENKYKSAGICLLAVIMEFLVNILGNGDINLFIGPIIIYIFSIVMYNAKWGNILISTSLIYTIMFGCECLFAMFFKVSNEEYKNLTQIPFQVIAVKLVTYTVLVIVIQILGKKNRKMKTWIFIKYLFIPLSGIGMMIVLFYSIQGQQDVQIEISGLVCFTLMLIGNILVFSAFINYTENMYITMEQKILLSKQEADINSYHQIMKNNEFYYEFIHNTKHYLNMICQLTHEKNYNAIIKVLDELDCRMTENELILYSEESHILNLILSEKRAKAVAKNINFDAYVEPGIVLSMVQDADLIAMLNNLMDNALRASEECRRDAFIKVRIFMQEVGGFCVIKVTNRFSGKVLLTEDSFLSTKVDGGIHGIGIKSVNGMAEKYGGCLECRVDDDIFESVLILSTMIV